MLLSTYYIQPQELTGYARAALADLQVNQFKLAAFLPNRDVDDLDYRFTKGGEGLAEAATFRAYDAESTIGSRPGLTRVSGELPPISRKIRLSEYDRLRQRKADGAVTNGIFSDAERMTRAVAARIELARGQALDTGKITIAENGITAVVDFGRSSSHTNVSPGTLWSVPATATPIANLQSFFDTYVVTNDGAEPEAIIMSRKALNAALRCAEVRDLGTVNGTTPSIISPATFASLLAAYGLPPVVINDEQIRVAGTATRVIADTSVILAPAPGDVNGESPLGGTLWGTTAESLEPDFNLTGEEPGIVAGAYSTKDPVAVWTKAAAIALPVLANPNLTLQAKVL